MNEIMNTLIPMLRIKACTTVNKVIFYFKRIPFIGKLLSDSAYSFGDIKLFVSVIMSLISLAYKFLGKFVYVLLCGLIPLGMLELEDQKIKTAVFVWVITLMSMLVGAFRQSVLLQNSSDKFLCIKLMRMPARQFAVSNFIVVQVRDFITFLPAFLVTGIFAGYSAGTGFIMTLLVIFAHIAGEALFLRVMDRTKCMLWKKGLFIYPVILLGSLAAFVPVFLMKLDSVWESFLLSASYLITGLPFVGAFLILSVLSMVYITKYNRYAFLFSRTLQASAVELNIKQATAQSRFADVQMKDKDLTAASLDQKAYAHKKGYDYLNAIFFRRHRRMIVKPIYIRLLVILILLLAGLIFWMFQPELGQKAAAALPNALPIFVFVMYFASIGERVCRAMFNNCDISLLRYSYYRERSVLLENFKIRLWTIIRLNLLVAAAICAALAIFTGVAGVNWLLGDKVLFMLSIFSLAVFFSVHHLFLYYVFQPYTTDLGMKNPFFQVINTGVYLVCYLCIQLDGAPRNFTVIVLAATVLYTVAALILVYRFAPKNFRVK